MGDDTQKIEAMAAEIQRLKWRISTLETAEFECARAVSALAASEARYRQLLDEAGFPITISVAADSSLLFANPLACRLFGLEGSVPAGRKMLEFYPEASQRSGMIERLRDSGSVRDWEVVMLDGQGQSRVMLVSATLIAYEGQEALLATSNDITARRHAEALFRTVIETSPDAIAIADLEGRLTYVSPRALQILGYGNPGEMLGRDLKEFIPKEEHARAASRLESILRGDYLGPTEWTGLHRSGQALPQEINGEVLRNPDGSPHAFFFLIRDLSNRKRVERAIRWAEKLESLGLMAAGIAHELNNAFQVTRGNLEIALAMSEGSAAITEILAKIGGGVDRATLLAREMLDYSGRTLRGEASLDMRQVVEEGLAFLRDFLDSKVSLVFVPNKQLPAIQGDEGQLMKVLSALVLNAVEAMEGRGGSVVISTEIQELSGKDFAAGFWPAPGREGHFLRLEIRDSGEGIPEKQLERICDPFFTTKGQGRGLGLSAALGILRAHSACLQIISKVGEGTSVRAYLPISVHTPSLPLSGENTGPAASGILVADDDDSIRDLVVNQLRDWGYSPVLEARNGAEALELFRNHPKAIGIVLTDASMPQMSGPQAFEAMKKLCPELLGILMTGYSDAFVQGTASAFGFARFLNKPFHFHELKARLDSLQSS